MRSFFQLDASRLGLTVILFLIMSLTTRAEVLHLDNQHMDFRVRYDAQAMNTNRLDLVLGLTTGAVSNHQAYIVRSADVPPNNIPANENFAFLGPAGAPIWILPKSRNVLLPDLGLSTEDLPAGTFADPMRYELRQVEGPGNFFAYDVPGIGQPPIVHLTATNGIVNSAFNHIPLNIGSHGHLNWAFSTNGLYRVTLRARGTLLDGGTVIEGREVAWAFQIQPLRPWEHWQSTNWLPATASSTNGPGADPDGDGIVNAMEYALGLNPNSPSTDGQPMVALLTEGAARYGTLTFTSVKAATDLGYQPSVRADLNTGEWLPLTNVVQTVDLGETEIVTVRDFMPVDDSTQRFYQLRVTLNYP